MTDDNQTLLLVFVLLTVVITIFSLKSKQKHHSLLINIISMILYGIPFIIGFLNNYSISFISWFFILIFMSFHETMAKGLHLY